eukprot:CAMPEP_0204568188 /NCGR_PEP_ID=MMETSP0661-20131031/37038_1 /ASSEMBLY_ACC=CAM_ASM_000606 /TAXON_ID=109239 /ORGANISM="Alexandrium margalefi, Strain AMGDE01CS-322" /LENGTH=227 /DNA_ID=CAMNT_0051576181 /DNA_START=43 /DNA_END=726 /DNA_ORIENTATION=+
MAEAATAAAAAAPGGAAELLEFVDTCARLKRTKRTGWVRKGVADAESVADHSFRVAAMALALGAEAGVDVARAVQMALVHDLAEAKVGDLVVDGEQASRDKVTRAEKAELEARAMDGICGTAGGAGPKIRALWDDFEAGKSAESRFVKDLDKLEMLCQARSYEEEQPGVNLDDFYRSTAEYSFNTEVCRSLDQEVRLRKRRRLLESGAADANVPGLAVAAASSGNGA